MNGTVNFLILGKDSGRSGRVWRSQAWMATGSSGGSFAQPLLFDTLNKGCSSPDGQLDVGDFPWSSQGGPSENGGVGLLSASSIENNQIKQSLREFDEMLDEFEDDDELFVQSPQGPLTPSRDLREALSRSASKNLFTRHSFQGLMDDTSNYTREGEYETIFDGGNPESGYTTGEQESSSSQASDSITSASSGLSSTKDKRPRQAFTSGFDASGFGSNAENPGDCACDGNDDSATRESSSSFDYEAIMRKKKTKAKSESEGMGLTDDELQRLNEILSDSSSSLKYESNLDQNERPATVETTNDEDLDVEQNYEEEETYSRISDPSTLTKTASFKYLPNSKPPPPPPPDFVPAPPPTDFVPPPPPDFVPAPPPLGPDELVFEYHRLDGVENITIDFQEEAENELPESAVVDDDEYMNGHEVREIVHPERSLHPFVPEVAEEPEVLPLAPADEFPWSAGDEDGDDFFPPPPAPPPPAPEPPSHDWSPPISRELSDHISTLEESIQNIQLRKAMVVSANGTTDVASAIANLILAGAFKLKQTSVGAAIRRESHSSGNEERNSLYNRRQEEQFFTNTNNTTINTSDNNNDTVYANASELPSNVGQIPGYQKEIPETTPPWRRDMIERKNRQLLEKFLEEKENVKFQEEKWKDMPEWKRNLLMQKEKKKKEEAHNPIIQNGFKSKQPPEVLQKSEAVNLWKQRFASGNL